MRTPIESPLRCQRCRQLGRECDACKGKQSDTPRRSEFGQLGGGNVLPPSIEQQATPSRFSMKRKRN